MELVDQPFAQHVADALNISVHTVRAGSSDEFSRLLRDKS